MREIPGQLRKLCNKRQLAGLSQSLGDLADALESGSGRDRWAHVDLYAAFLGAGAHRASAPGRASGYALPILTLGAVATWFARHPAGQAISWESGLGWSALAAVLLLAVVLWRRARADAEVRAELTAVLVAADLDLAAERQAAPGRLTAELDRAASAFGATAAEIREAGVTASRSQQDATAALREIRLATQAMEQAMGAIQDATEQAGRAATDVGGELGRVSAAFGLTTATTTAGTWMSRAGDEFGGRLAEVAADFADRMRQVTEDNQRAYSAAMGSSAQRIATTLESGGVQVRDALAAISTTGAAYEQAAGTLGAADESLRQMAETARQLEARLTAVHQTENRIVVVLGELRAALDAASRTTRSAGHDELRDVLAHLAESVRYLDRRMAVEARPAAPVPAARGLRARLLGS
jgi:hypothetical protein